MFQIHLQYTYNMNIQYRASIGDSAGCTVAIVEILRFSPFKLYTTLKVVLCLLGVAGQHSTT